MIKVIINADDLGKDPVVNAEIDNALQKHLITSSTILANSSYWNDVHHVIANNPNASFGVHLNLTEGKALTDSPIFHELNIVDDNNCFTKKIQTISDYSDELIEAIFQEWDAQVNKIVNVEGITISHFDGHHHIHAKWELRYVLLKLLKKYNIPRIRNRYVSPCSMLKRASVMCLNNASKWKMLFNVIGKHRDSSLFFRTCYSYMEAYQWRVLFQKQGVALSDYFGAYENWVKMLEDGLECPDNTVVELMCHPGHPKYLEEYEMIAQDRLQLNLCKHISYKDI